MADPWGIDDSSEEFDETPQPKKVVPKPVRKKPSRTSSQKRAAKEKQNGLSAWLKGDPAKARPRFEVSSNTLPRASEIYLSSKQEQKKPAIVEQLDENAKQNEPEVDHIFFRDHTMFKVGPPENALLEFGVDRLIAKTIAEFLYFETYRFAVNPMVLNFHGPCTPDSRMLDERTIKVGNDIFEDSSMLSTVNFRDRIVEDRLMLSMDTLPFKDLSAFEEMCWFDNYPLYEYSQNCPDTEHRIFFPHDKIFYQFEHEIDMRQTKWKPEHGVEFLRYGLLVYSVYERYICALTYGKNVELRVVPISDESKVKRFFHNLNNFKSAADPDDLFFLDELTLITEFSPDEAYLNVSNKFRSPGRITKYEDVTCDCDACAPPGTVYTPNAYPMVTPTELRIRLWHRDHCPSRTNNWVKEQLQLDEHMYLVGQFKLSGNIARWRKYVKENVNGRRSYDPLRHTIESLRNYLMLPEVQCDLAASSYSPELIYFDIPEFFVARNGVVGLNQKIAYLLERNSRWLPRS